MAEYIEREYLIKRLKKRYNDPNYWHAGEDWRMGLSLAKDIVDEAPACYVAEVRHGEWVDGHCTECGEEAIHSTFDEAIYDYDWEENLQYSYTETHVEYHLTDYCPHCGAMMDRKGESDGE